MTLQEAINKAVSVLGKRGPLNTSNLGWEVFGDTCKTAMRGEGSHGHNKFCRIIGKVIKAAERQGLITIDRELSTHSSIWRLTFAGQKFNQERL